MRAEEWASSHREDGKSAKNERKKMGISAAMLVVWPEHGWHELLREGAKCFPSIAWPLGYAQRLGPRRSGRNAVLWLTRQLQIDDVFLIRLHFEFQSRGFAVVVALG